MNYNRLSLASQYYERQGFKYIDAPWTTDWDVNLETAPVDNVTFYPLDNKLLVASGEQSFIQLLKEGKLSNGLYQTITPCFRDDKEDEIHQRYFTKLELIDVGCTESLFTMIDDVKKLHNRYTNVKVVETPQGYDIVDIKTGIELGSYGKRITKFGDFYYGTGLAEPRMSIVMEKNK